MNTPETQEALLLPPEAILADHNSRFALKPYRVDSLMKSILEQGGVLQNLIAEEIETPVNGQKYRLVAGFYRHAAVTKANKEQKAGLLLPVVIQPAQTEAQRLRTQLAENMERENQSPMDKAVAMRELTDSGLSRQEIREIFAVPGGRKGGTKMQPASNSFLNMHMSFLDFPKDIQNKIHHGVIGVGGAYQLRRTPREKWDEVIGRLEADRLKAEEQEEKEEISFLAAEKKEAERKAAAEAIQADVQAAQEAAEAATKAAKDANAVEQEKYSVNKKAKGDEKKAADEAFKAAQVATKAAEKVEADAVKELEKAAAKLAKLKEAETKRLEASKGKVTDGKAKGAEKPAGASEVRKAAAAVGAGGVVPLNAVEMRKTILFGASTDHLYPKVGAIFKQIKACFDSQITEGQMIKEIAKLVGDKKSTAKDKE